MVDLARKNLLHDKLRFGITVAGVAFAVTLVLFQVGLFLGLLDNASVIIEHLDADLWVTPRNTANVDFSKTFPETRVHRVRSIPGVARADNMIVAYMDVSLPTGSQEGALTYAVEDFRLWGLPWDWSGGDPEDLRRGPYVMIDGAAESRFGPFEVGDYREFLGKRMKVIGKTRGALTFTTMPVTFMDLRTVQELVPDRYAGQATYILVKLTPGADVDAVRQEIQRRLPYNDVYSRAAWARQSRAYWIKSTGLGFTMGMTVFLGCLVGIVIVAQTLYTSTMEHLREFGTLKAIGGSNALIYRILTRQALISGLVGFVLGAGLVMAARPLLHGSGMKLVLPSSFGVFVFVGTLVMCVAAAMVSFRKVASIDPALVFRG